jgi:hypothetical protein
MVAERKIKVGEVSCNMQDLLFDVELRDNPMPANSEYKKIVVGQIGGSDFFLNACSPRYELVKNVDIFPNIESVLNANGIQFEVNYSHIDNVRFYADYRITDKQYAYNMVGTNDEIQPLIRVQHSYNGLTKYRIVFGYFRLVCSNGMVIPVQEMKQYNLAIIGKHTESIRHSFDELDKMLKFFASDARQVTLALTAKYEMLGGRMVANVQDRIAEVLKAGSIISVEQKNFNTVENIYNRITEELRDPRMTAYNGKINDWLIYNGVNQYIFDDSRNIVAPEKRIETDSKVFEYMLQNA